MKCSVKTFALPGGIVSELKKQTPASATESQTVRIDFDPCDAVTWDMVTTLDHGTSEVSYALNLQWEAA